MGEMDYDTLDEPVSLTLVLFFDNFSYLEKRTF